MVVDAVKLLRQARRQIKEAAAPTAPQSPVTQSTRPPADSPPALWLRTFPVDDGDELRVWEDPRGTLGGGNGATVWDSALAFSTAVLSDDDEEDKKASAVVNARAATPEMAHGPAGTSAKPSAVSAHFSENSFFIGAF